MEPSGLNLLGDTQFAHLADYLRAKQLPQIRDYDATMGTCLHDMSETGLLQLDLDRQAQIRNQMSKMWYLVA